MCPQRMTARRGTSIIAGHVYENAGARVVIDSNDQPSWEIAEIEGNYWSGSTCFLPADGNRACRPVVR